MGLRGVRVVAARCCASPRARCCADALERSFACPSANLRAPSRRGLHPRSVRRGPNGAVRIKMHNKLAALVVLGKYLGMFDERPQNSNVIYAISDEPMSAEEWKRQFVKPG